MKKCDDCQGQGEIELFTSWAECEKCGGTGEVGESNDLSEERYSIQWDEAKDFTIIDTGRFRDLTPRDNTFADPNPITYTGDNPCAEVSMGEPVASSFPVPPEKETTIPVLAGDQKIGEVTDVHASTTNDPCTVEVSFTINLQHHTLDDVADIEEVSLRVNDNGDAFPVVQGHRHVEKKSSVGFRVKNECTICQKKECKHLGFDEDKLDQDAKSSRPASRSVQNITGRSAGIEPPLENTFKRKYGTNSERTRLFRDDLAQAEQRIMRQMVRALRLNEEDVNNEED